MQNLRQFFEEAFAFIDLARRDRSGVLIHCHAGVSRSPTIAVAYLMKRFFPMAMGDAYKFVKTRRSIISPNLNFMGQLWEFEQGLRTEKEAGNLNAKPDDDDDIDDMEMREVRESLASSSEESALSSSSSSTDSNGSGGEWSSTAPSATALTAPPSASPFRWTERQHKSKEASQTGCSV